MKLYLGEAGTVTSIDVTLEGVSASKLTPSGKSKPVEEIHKLVYQRTRVWDFYRGDANMQGHYTMQGGEYQMPFSFRLPLQTGCHPSSKLNLDTLVSFSSTGTKHVQASLPPSMGGLPDFAGIIYYIKAEIRTKDIFSKDPKAWLPITFLPVESPRPPLSGAERFARQTIKDCDGCTGSKIQASPKSCFKVDARLPDPPILTCNQRPPLTVTIERMHGCNATAFLQDLDVHLLGHTEVTCGDSSKVRTVTWILGKHERLSKPLFESSEAMELSDQPGKRALEVLQPQDYLCECLPMTVAPSFEVCNVKRSYELDISVGISAREKPPFISIRTEKLRLACSVYSGISQNYSEYGPLSTTVSPLTDGKEVNDGEQHPPGYTSEPAPPTYEEDIKSRAYNPLSAQIDEKTILQTEKG